jgi:hypothetical protein
MGPLEVWKGADSQGNPGTWVVFEPASEPVFVEPHRWVGVDLDGTLARDDAPGHFEPPYPLGEPIPEMIALIQSLLEAGLTVKIFTARACEPETIPEIQVWAEKHGLGRLEVTNLKDYNLIRFYDDRAIQMARNSGKSVGLLARTSQSETPGLRAAPLPAV